MKKRKTIGQRAQLSWQLADMPNEVRRLRVLRFNLGNDEIQWLWRIFSGAYIAGYRAAQRDARSFKRAK